MPPKQDPKKMEAERLSGFLQELLREEENKYCADCEAKQPRWASWNLGVFLCIRCAGLHRNLGVHISKVKSVNLDSWTAEQVQSMRVMGNAKAKAVYEAELPQMFRRPQSDQSLEAFIRAKYETRRYILQDWQAPPVNVSDLPERAGTQNVKSGKSFTPTNTLSLPKVSPKSQASVEVQPSQQAALAQSSLLIDLSAPTEPTPASSLGLDNSLFAQSQTNVNEESSCATAGDLDDFLYGPVVSAPSVPTPTPESVVESGNSVTQKKKSKDDILALFSNTRPTPASVGTNNGMIAPAIPALDSTVTPGFGATVTHSAFGAAAQPLVFPHDMAFGMTTTPDQTQFGQMSSMVYNNTALPTSANLLSSMGAFGSTGATPPTNNRASGLDDLLGQFKL